MRIGKRGLLAFSLLQLASYVLLIQAEALRSSTAFDAVTVDFCGDRLSQVLNGLALILGYSIAYLTPGLLWVAKGDGRNPGELLVKSALMSVVLYTGVFSLLKLLFAVELSRAWMVLTFAVTALVWAFLDRRPFSIRLEHFTRSLGSGGFAVLFLLVLLYGKIYPENFSGDGTESFEFSLSLKTSVLPHWDLENGYFGFYPRFMFFAYTNLISILHVGEIPAAVRLPFFIVLFGVYVLIASLSGAIASRDRGFDRVLIGGALVLFAVFNVFYSTWHPHFADIAEPTHVDTLVTVYVLSAIYFYVAKQTAWFLLSCVFASLSVANGVFLILVLLATLFSTETQKRRVLGLGLCFLLLYGAYLGFVSLYDRYHPLGFQRWSLEGMLDYFSWTELLDPGRYFPHLKYLMMMTAALPVILVPRIRNRDGVSVAVYFTGISYVSGVFFFGRPNPHYFTSVALLFLVPFLRKLDSMDTEKAQYLKLTYASAIAATLAVVFPFRYIVNQEAQRLGARTCIDAIDYRTRVGLAESIYRSFPFESHGVGHHTLVFYATKGPCSTVGYDYILTSSEKPIEAGDFRRLGDTDLLVRKGIDRSVAPQASYEGNYRLLLKDVYERNRER